MDGTLGPPTLPGFLAFLNDIVGITPDLLPVNSPVVIMALNISEDIVNQDLQLCSSDIYTLAVYYLATSNVINWAPDQPNAPVYQNGKPFFAYMRATWGIFSGVTGIVQSASDVSTSESMVVPDWAKELSIAEMQLRKDPYGLAYLALAQKYGTLWGIT